MSQYYKASNKMHWSSFILSMLLSLILNLLLTGLLAIVGLWLAKPYIGIVLVCITAYISKFIYEYLLKVTRTRNKAVARITVFFLSLLTAYFHMVVVVSAINTLGIFIEETNPSIYISALNDIFYTNIFTPALFGDSPLIAMPYYVINSFLSSGISWVAYLVVILLSYLILPQFALVNIERPFSEIHNKWMTKVYSVGRVIKFIPEEYSTIKACLESKQVDILLQRTRCTRYNTPKYARLFFYKIDNLNSGYVGIDNFYHNKSKNNEFMPDDYKKEEYFPPIMVGREHADLLEASLNASAMMSFGVEDSIPASTFNKMSKEQKISTRRKPNNK